MSERVQVNPPAPITVKIRSGDGSGVDSLARQIANAAFQKANSGARTAFTTINIGANGSPFSANSNTDTLRLIEGTGIMLESDLANDAVIITATGGCSHDPYARNTANSAVRFGFTTIVANGVSLVPTTNLVTLYLTSVQANSIQIQSNTISNTIDIGLQTTGATAGSYGTSNTLTSIVVDALGRVLAVANVTPSFNTAVLTSGVLTVIRGGTGFTSFTDRQILVGNTTSGGLDRPTLQVGQGLQLTSNANVLSIATTNIPILTRSVSYGTPLFNEIITLFYTNTAITVTEVRSVVVGTTPNITFNLIYTSDRSNTSGTPIATGIVCANTTFGLVTNSFLNASIPANNYILLHTTNLSGTVDELAATMFLTNP